MARRAWTVSIILGICTELAKIRRALETAKETGDEVKKKAAVKKSLITIVCHLGDTGVPAVIGWDRKWSDMRVGFLHTVAALIQSSNLYPG